MSFASDSNSNAGENSAAKNDLYDAEATVSYDDTPQTQFPAIEGQSTFKQRVIDFVSGPTATVDLVHSTTTPLPLAPIDYSDPSQVTAVLDLSLIHISEPTRPVCSSRMPSSA